NTTETYSPMVIRTANGTGSCTCRQWSASAKRTRSRRASSAIAKSSDSRRWSCVSESSASVAASWRMSCACRVLPTVAGSAPAPA
ncbi:hypothetical protein GGI00_006216, partial [Coemansia sp. RSA 2681]